MPIIKQSTLDGLNTTIEDLDTKWRNAVDKAEELRSERNTAQLALDGLKRTVRISSKVDKKLQEHAEGVVVGNYEAQVVDELVAEGKEVIAESLKEGLRRQKRDELLEHLRVTEGPAIREELDKLFETDGTYAELEEDVRIEVMRGIAADLRAEADAKTRAELDDPATKATFVASIASEVANDPEVIEHARLYRQSLEAEWRDEAIEMAHTAAEHEVLANKDLIVADTIESYKNSRQGDEKLEKVRKSTKKRIHELTIEELLRDSENDVHRTVLEERRALEAEKLAKQNYAERLALTFTNGGIDSKEIEQGTVVQLLLGRIGTGETKRTDGRGYTRDVSVSMLFCKRKITVTSMGKGMFRVDKDTLADSTNPYAQEEAISEGSVIAIGMLVREVEGAEQSDKLSPVLKAGSTLHYDTDTTTAEFTNTHLSLADVNIDGVSARKYEEMKEQYL